ncbi:pseudouridine synthase [Sanguibacter antarcticus]|uniref:RNA pseudouridylate synthase n=1 Tax=Sanguibacter antarcticus TaxID=372484 RepID=A0A2A9E6X4_9MICO|nr:pseudouridine synthase [Sanguibacter antarcticus]PFG33959.1 tRNA pseudouridine32 synthase / 23S rRNA pseudouridine746 synthase [Sanguibacter antarcticus]
MRTPPLPVRDGLNPVRLQLPQRGVTSGPGHVPGTDEHTVWLTVLDYLVARFPADESRLREKVAGREVVDDRGQPVDETTPFVPGGAVSLYRDPPVESRVPFEIDVLHEDDDLLVVDKPHFLATMPRGAYVVESVVVRLRRATGLSEISPAHRLDRVTAGVLVLTKRREVRGRYQELFARRRVVKTYEAVSAGQPDVGLPHVVRNRVVKERGVLQAEIVSGEPNTETRIEMLDQCTDPVQGVLRRFRLYPRTGKIHQLRLHMASIGSPILNDNFYPSFYDVAPDDYAAPVQLLARSLAFDDPVTGRRREFVSRRELAAWVPPEQSAGDR